MQAWADHCDGKGAGATVVRIAERRRTSSYAGALPRPVGDEIRQWVSFVSASRDSSDKIDGLPQPARPFHSPDPPCLQHIKLKRALLATHREFPQPAAGDSGRQRGETIKQSHRSEDPIVGVAASLQNTGGRVHGIADKRDLFP